MGLREKMLSDSGIPGLLPRIDEITNTLCEWTGSEAQAYQWYVEHPIASLCNKTAEQLVQEKDLTLVLDFLRRSERTTH